MSWPLVMAGGTALRVLVERRRVVTRGGAFRNSYVMAAVQAAAVVVLWLLDGERADLGILAFWVLLLAAVPTLLYAALMPLAGERWLSLSRFTRGRASRAHRPRAD